MSKRKNEDWDVVIIGAGASGIFAALRCRELSPERSVLVLEKAPKPLRKVTISGGGRCNVTHDCHDLDDLLSCYPRGGYRLEPILARFMPTDTIAWFEQRGVKLKVEADGRMFPVTNRSQTIVDCLLGEAERLGVELRTRTRVDALQGRKGEFLLTGPELSVRAKKVLLATGGASKATSWLKVMGHKPEEDIPSLFTFCCQSPIIQELQGLSVQKVGLKLQTNPRFESEGPLLVTHWGLSGPAVLKLSAFAARALWQCQYRAELVCDLLPDLEEDELAVIWEKQNQRKQVFTACPFPEIPKRLWRKLAESAGVGETQTWKQLKNQKRVKLASALKRLSLFVDGKGVFKEEFVTSGGVELCEMDVYTMESKSVPGLFVAGELLNVDGITGGFNFQNAWATGFIAGEGLSS